MSYRPSAAFLDCLDNSREKERKERERKDFPLEFPNTAKRILGKALVLKTSFMPLNEVRVNVFLTLIFRVFLLVSQKDL